MSNCYIGITDFMTSDQVRRMLDVLRSTSDGWPIRKLGVGVMMSRKTLNGLPSQFTKAFPPKEKIADIFSIDHLAYNVLHYADYEGIDVLENLMEAAKWGGPNMQAMQLDMIWPDPEAIKAFRKCFPYVRIILQVNSPALSQVNCCSLKLIDTLRAYGSSIDGVLLDMSMGRGKPMSWQELLSYLASVYLYLPNLQLAAAGGLGPNSLDLVEPLVKCLRPEISIDAEGKLRPSGNILEPIDWSMAEEYITKAVQMFQARHQSKRE